MERSLPDPPGVVVGGVDLVGVHAHAKEHAGVGAEGADEVLGGGEAFDGGEEVEQVGMANGGWEFEKVRVDVAGFLGGAEGFECEMGVVAAGFLDNGVVVGAEEDVAEGGERLGFFDVLGGGEQRGFDVFVAGADVKTDIVFGEVDGFGEFGDGG